MIQSSSAPRATSTRRFNRSTNFWITPPAVPMRPKYARSMVIVSQHKSDEAPVEVIKSTSSGSSNSPSPVSTPSNAAPLIVTESTWNRIRQLNEKKGADQYLRVFVDAGGCSGFSYVFELNQDEIDPDEDTVLVGPAGQRVVVDEASLNLIRGSTIDYVQEMIKSSFEVRENPQSESACGCGSSFAVKNFAANPAID